MTYPDQQRLAGGDMVNQPMYSQESYSHNPAEFELVHALLQDEIPYVWNPIESTAEIYFTELEQTAQLAMEGVTPGQVDAFYTSLDQLWSQVNRPVPSIAALVVALGQRFADRIPQSLLTAIVEQAAALHATGLSRLDQLTQTVQQVLPTWGEEDLQVLARPLAYAMRGYAMRGEGGTTAEQMLSTVRSVDWESLSEIEQTRLCLSIAHLALEGLEQSEQ